MELLFHSAFHICSSGRKNIGGGVAFRGLRKVTFSTMPVIVKSARCSGPPKPKRLPMGS